jgi:hypothetical protein
VEPALIIFTLGGYFLAYQIWAQYQSADKGKQAKKHLVLILLFTTVALLVELYKFGFLSDFINLVSKFLKQQISFWAFLVWTVVIILVPRVSKIWVAKLARGTLLKPHLQAKTKSKKRVRKKAKPLFQDNLKTDLNNYEIMSGAPSISYLRGLPTPPSLLLEEFPNDRRHSSLLLKEKKLKNGKLSADIYLEREAVFNFIFRSTDDLITKFYMARVDSRPGGSNGILECAGGAGNWHYILQPNTYVPNDQWIHIELVFAERIITFSIGDQTISYQSDQIGEGRVGMFNEVKRAFVNNFVVESV